MTYNQQFNILFAKSHYIRCESWDSEKKTYKIVLVLYIYTTIRIFVKISVLRATTFKMNFQSGNFWSTFKIQHAHQFEHLWSLRIQNHNLSNDFQDITYTLFPFIDYPAILPLNFHWRIKITLRLDTRLRYTLTLYLLLK